MAAWIIVIGTVVAVAGMVVVLARQGSPGRLSEEDRPNRSRPTRVMDPPAGPDAEAMAVGEPGQPMTAPTPVEDRPVSPPSPPPADAERPVDPDIEGMAEEDRPAKVGHDERPVPDEVNKYVPEDDEPEA